MHLVLVIAAIAVWAALSQLKANPTVPATPATKSSGLSRTTLLEGFVALPNLNIGGIWPLLSRAQVISKLGEPKGQDQNGWEDFGEVQILWNNEPEMHILGLRGKHLFESQEPIVSIGDPLQKVLDRIGRPQELQGAGDFHRLNYVGNNLRILAVGPDQANMGVWQVRQLTWGSEKRP